MIKGIIIKALSGFYYVKTDDNLIECKARGSFRRKELSPLVGDNVEIEITGENKGVIDKILTRKNFLIRPPVANIDQLLIVVSVADPLPNTFVIDKLIVSAEDKKIEPIIVVNKSDLQSTDEIFEIYKKAGFDCYKVCATNGNGIDKLLPLFKNKITAFSGNSGVGKSSILNAIDSRFEISTGETSKKLGRGKHTTRHCELFYTHGGYIADTPGFSSIDMEKVNFVRKENLQFCFREFEPYITTCKFTSCSHTKEKGCSIIDAVDKGDICKSRFESYVALYEEANKLKDWEIDKL